MLTRIRDDEEGVALILSLMVMFVVMLLGIAVFAQAMHNTTASGYDRKRLQSVSSAEAGLDYFYNCLEHTEASQLASCAASGSVDVAPGRSSFTINPTWYAASDGTGAPMDPSTFNDTIQPRSVRVVSTGTTNGRTSRRMESFMGLTPVFGGFGGAIVTDSSLNLVNSFTISGNNITDGDVYVTCPVNQPICDASLTATSGNQVIKGSIYTPKGSLSIGTQVHVYGSVWARDALTINHPQALVDQDAKSSTSTVSIPAGNVTGVGTYCLPPAPSSSKVHGGTVQLCQGPPPSPSFPELTYPHLDDNRTTVYPASLDTSLDEFWNLGCTDPDKYYCYKQVNFGSQGSTDSSACTAARDYIEGTTSGFRGGLDVPSNRNGVIVRILSKCTYTSSNNARITVGKDLAIISNGSIQLSQQSTWTGTVSGTETQRRMFLIVPWPQTACPTGDITVGNNTNFNALIAVGLYTPCTAHMSNQNAFYGQVVGGTVDIGQNWNMNYRPVVFPGGHTVSYKQDVAYIREIR